MKIKRRIFSKLKIILITIAALCFLLLGIFFLRSNFWAVESISCQRDGISCGQELEEKLRQNVIGKNILFISKKKLREAILNEELLLKDLSVSMRPPNNLAFQLKKREPEVAIVMQLSVEGNEATASASPQFLTDGNFFVVDREGIVLSEEKKTDLPLVLLDSNIEKNIGSKISRQDVLTMIDLMADLRLYLFEPKLSRLLGLKSIEVWFKNNEVAVFSAKKELKSQLDSLQLIFSRAKIEGSKVRRVDLRFDKPVATYE